MKVFLLALSVLLMASVCYLRKLGKRCRKNRDDVVRLVIVVKNQEPWVEGFLRRIFLFRSGKRFLEIVVVDDGSSDQTREVLARLQRKYYFDLVCGLNTMVKGREPAGDRIFDARGLTGRALLNAPVFSQLKAMNAGNSSVLSK